MPKDPSGIRMDYKHSWETTDGVSALKPRPVPASSSDTNERAAAQQSGTRRTQPDVAPPPPQSTARTSSGSGTDYAAQTKQNTRLNRWTNKPNRSFRNKKKKKNSQPAIARAPPPPPLREDYEMVDLDVTILSAAPNRDGSTIMSVVNSSENFHPVENASSDSDDDSGRYDAIRDNRRRKRESSANKNNNNGRGFSRLCCFRGKQ